MSIGSAARIERCGYKTFSLYPFYGSFFGSRAFQTTAGIANYLDMLDLGTRDFEADSFYYDRAIDRSSENTARGPLFLYVYTVANHFPWDTRLHQSYSLIGVTLATRRRWKSIFGVRG